MNIEFFEVSKDNYWIRYQVKEVDFYFYSLLNYDFWDGAVLERAEVTESHDPVLLVHDFRTRDGQLRQIAYHLEPKNERTWAIRFTAYAIAGRPQPAERPYYIAKPPEDEPVLESTAVIDSLKSLHYRNTTINCRPTR